MQIIFTNLISAITLITALIWGPTGHRVVGDIASQYLNPAAKMEVSKILGNESIAIASTWMDFIRSDPQFDFASDWHWVTIPDGKTYEETEKNPNGDVIEAIRRLSDKLKKGNLSPDKEKETLRMLIHLVGDIHQPLHVGTGDDRGGNEIRVHWMNEPSNLHSIWDFEMINQTQLSYTELSNSINYPTSSEIIDWQNSTVLDWAEESKNLRETVYDFSEDKRLGYRYMFHNYPVVEKRLLQAGVRLAGLLNEIYGTAD